MTTSKSTTKTTDAAVSEQALWVELANTLQKLSLVEDFAHIEVGQRVQKMVTRARALKAYTAQRNKKLEAKRERLLAQLHAVEEAMK